MRNSGVHWFHHWRVFPSQADAQGNLTFTIRIDGEDKGMMKATTLEEAIKEAKAMIEKMMKDGQR